MAADPNPAPTNGHMRPSSERLAAALAALESGLTVVATEVPLPDGGSLDVLAADASLAPVLVIGASDDAFARVAEAWVGWQSAAPLLTRLIPSDRLRVTLPARVLLVGNSISERTRKRLALLALPDLRCVEAAIAAAPPPPETVPSIVLATSSPGFARSNGVGIHTPPPIGIAAAETSVMNGAPEPVEVQTVAAAPHTNGIANGAGIETNGAASVETNGVEHSSARWFDELKQRVLRLSPEVIEETDGDEVTFRVAGQLLVRLTRNGRSVMVSTAGSATSESASQKVEDEESLEAALDGVFGRFFGLAATRRRLQAAEPRPRQIRSLRLPSENGRRK